jgi:hypothetical protein
VPWGRCVRGQKKYEIKSLETAGVVRDNAVVSMGRCNTICYKTAR